MTAATTDRPATVALPKARPAGRLLWKELRTLAPLAGAVVATMVLVAAAVAPLLNPGDRPALFALVAAVGAVAVAGAAGVVVTAGDREDRTDRWLRSLPAGRLPVLPKLTAVAVASAAAALVLFAAASLAAVACGRGGSVVLSTALGTLGPLLAAGGAGLLAGTHARTVVRGVLLTLGVLAAAFAAAVAAGDWLLGPRPDYVTWRTAGRWIAALAPAGAAWAAVRYGRADRPRTPPATAKRPDVFRTALTPLRGSAGARLGRSLAWREVRAAWPPAVVGVLAASSPAAVWLSTRLAVGTWPAVAVELLLPWFLAVVGTAAVFGSLSVNRGRGDAAFERQLGLGGVTAYLARTAVWGAAAAAVLSVALLLGDSLALSGRLFSGAANFPVHTDRLNAAFAVGGVLLFFVAQAIAARLPSPVTGVLVPLTLGMPLLGAVLSLRVLGTPLWPFAMTSLAAGLLAVRASCDERRPRRRPVRDAVLGVAVAVAAVWGVRIARVTMVPDVPPTPEFATAERLADAGVVTVSADVEPLILPKPGAVPSDDRERRLIEAALEQHASEVEARVADAIASGGVPLTRPRDHAYTIAWTLIESARRRWRDGDVEGGWRSLRRAARWSEAQTVTAVAVDQDGRPADKALDHAAIMLAQIAAARDDRLRDHPREAGLAAAATPEDWDRLLTRGAAFAAVAGRPGRRGLRASLTFGQSLEHPDALRWVLGLDRSRDRAARLAVAVMRTARERGLPPDAAAAAHGTTIGRLREFLAAGPDASPATPFFERWLRDN